MRRWLLALLLIPALVWATTEPTIYWEHDGVGVTSFTCQIDSGTAVSLGLPTPTGTTYSSALSNCGTIAAGTHTLTIRACNGSTCTAGTSIYVVKL
jgi:hypothetical protein